MADASTLAKELRPAIKTSESRRDSILAMTSNFMCDASLLGDYLEVWPPAFRSLNILSANFLNFPGSLLGLGVSKESLQAAITSSSCMHYLRDEAVVSAGGDAVEAFSRSLAQDEVLSDEALKQAQAVFSEGDLEWLALGVSLRGFFDKFSSSLQLRLDETQTDRSKLFKKAYHLASSQQLERHYSNGVSNNMGATFAELESVSGYSWPYLSSLTNKRAFKALAVALCENLHVSRSQIGIETKLLTGIIYAKVTSNEKLMSDSLQLIAHLAPDLPEKTIRCAVEFVSIDNGALPVSFTNEQSAAVLLARSIAATPCKINEITISMVCAELTSKQIIEIITWVSLQEMLGRLYKFYS